MNKNYIIKCVRTAAWLRSNVNVMHIAAYNEKYQYIQYIIKKIYISI